VLIVIAGCGRVGSNLAMTLSDEGHDVSVVDEDPKKIETLGASFNGRTQVGLAYDVQTLRMADIEFADAFVAVTSNDNANVMAVQVAKNVFGVRKTIARMDDPARADVYRALDVQYVLGAHLVSRVIHEQLVERGFNIHISFGSGDIEIVEMRLGASAEGVTVREFQGRDGVRVSVIERNGTTFIPEPETQLKSGDLVVAAAKLGMADRIHDYLEDAGA
jgi:trk/ktr system potassium uptake protein